MSAQPNGDTAPPLAKAIPPPDSRPRFDELALEELTQLTATKVHLISEQLEENTAALEHLRKLTQQVCDQQLEHNEAIRGLTTAVEQLQATAQAGNSAQTEVLQLLRSIDARLTVRPPQGPGTPETPA